VTPFDYVAIAVLTVSLLVGVLRGVVSELLALAAWVVAFIAARIWGSPVGALLLTNWPDPLWQQLTGFVVVLVGVLMCFALLRRVLALLLKAVGLRPFDRALGAVFGLARGVMLLFALVMLGGLTPLPKEQWWRGALMAPPLETGVLVAKPWLPAELAQRIQYR
jgi:membrane protein required for colicin V production